MLRRAFIPACVLIALAFTITLLRPDASPPPGRGVLSSPVSDSPSYELVGLNETIIPIGTWGAALHANEVRAEAERQAAEARARARVTVRPSSYGGPLRAVNWDGIAQCETGGNWQHQTAYDGGLGILHAAWIEFGGRDFAEYGSQASREEQIVVAERLYHRFGNLRGWGCHAYG